MGKLTPSVAILNSYVSHNQRVLLAEFDRCVMANQKTSLPLCLRVHWWCVKALLVPVFYPRSWTALYPRRCSKMWPETLRKLKPMENRKSCKLHSKFRRAEEPVSPEQTDVEDKVEEVLSKTHGELWRKWGAMGLYHRKARATCHMSTAGCHHVSNMPHMPSPSLRFSWYYNIKREQQESMCAIDIAVAILVPFIPFHSISTDIAMGQNLWCHIWVVIHIHKSHLEIDVHRCSRGRCQGFDPLPHFHHHEDK